MRMSDGSSDVCSSDLWRGIAVGDHDERRAVERGIGGAVHHVGGAGAARRQTDAGRARDLAPGRSQHGTRHLLFHEDEAHVTLARRLHQLDRFAARMPDDKRSEEHTSELQSLMRISYAVFCLKQKKTLCE